MSSDLDSTLRVLCARGRAAHPDLGLGEAAFLEHLARCGAPVATGSELVFAGDLFFAAAVLAGVPGAAAKLQRDHQAVVAAYVRPFEFSPDQIAEIEQMLWSKLLVGDAREPAKLYSYSGRGALAGFVGISAQRLALDMLRRQTAEARARAAIRAEPDAVAGDAELAFIRRRYRDGFQRAFRDGLAVLDDRERMVFRMKIVDGVNIDRIAKAYGVNRATVSRWVARARKKVLSEAYRALREHLSLTESEFDSVASLMVSQLDVSVSSVLAR